MNMNMPSWEEGCRLKTTLYQKCPNFCDMILKVTKDLKSNTGWNICHINESRIIMINVSWWTIIMVREFLKPKGVLLQLEGT